MQLFSAQEISSMRPRSYALNLKDGGTSIIRAYLKENALLAAQKRHPDQEVSPDDLYPACTSISDCCDEPAVSGHRWNPSKQVNEDTYAFNLK